MDSKLRTTSKPRADRRLGREWPCVEFANVNLLEPKELVDFILWLGGAQKNSRWPEPYEDPAPDDLLETLWGWDGAPRKRMAKLCWQLLVKNNSSEHFHQHFTLSEHWLIQQISGGERLLSPIQGKLKWVLEGFRDRRREDNLIGQGNWGEEWLLPPEQTEYVRNQLRRTRPSIVEESSNYEDALHYYHLPFFEVASSDVDRNYLGKHREGGGAYVWIRDSSGNNYPLLQTSFPFAQSPGTGFSWGYGGGGPSALALSILADACHGDLDLAKQFQLQFLEEVLMNIPWSSGLKLGHRRVLRWLKARGINDDELKKADEKVSPIAKSYALDLATQKERIVRIRQIGGLRMQRFAIVPPDFESALYVDLMNMFERASWVLHCSGCGQPIACDRSPRGNRQRARWIAGRPVYHERCFIQHARDRKRMYWAERSKEDSFRLSERQRARKRRKSS